MKNAVLFFLKIYQQGISPLMGNNCRFYPSCSHYAQEALSRKGTLRGMFLSAKRILKCHPFHAGGFDPVE